MSMNFVGIMGRLTRDPEVRHTGSGITVTSFTLAVDRDYTPKDSNEKETDFIDCVAWRQTGEFVGKYFTKGRMAAVVGRLEMRTWTDKDGNKRKSLEVNADSVYFADSKKPEGQTNNPGNGGYNAAPQGGFAPQGNGGYNAAPQGGFALQGNAGYATAPQGGFAPQGNGGYGAAPQGGFAPQGNGGYGAAPQGGYVPQGGYPSYPPEEPYNGTEPF